MMEQSIKQEIESKFKEKKRSYQVQKNYKQKKLLVQLSIVLLQGIKEEGFFN